MPVPKALQDSLNAFRKKYYTNEIIRGSIFLCLLLSSVFLTVVFGEVLFNFSVTVRTVLFFSTLLVFLAVLVWKILIPGLKLMRIGKVLSDAEAAIFIGKYISEIDDKLLNIIQLSSVSESENLLLQAAIERKSKELILFPFTRAVSFSANRKRARYLLIPLLVIVCFLVFKPDVLTQGSYRIVNYNQDFPPPPPFFVIVSHIPNQVEEGSHIQISAEVAGNEIPSELFLYVNRQGSDDWIPVAMQKKGMKDFSGDIHQIEDAIRIQVGNPEVKSKIFSVDVWKAPSVERMQAIVRYPAYTKRKADTLSDNVGDFTTLKGSFVTWNIKNRGDAKSAFMILNQQKIPLLSDKNSGFVLNRIVTEETDYKIQLVSEQNRFNTDTVSYHILIEEDRYPTAIVRGPEIEFKIGLNGILPLDYELGDDYGLSRAELHYRYVKSNDAEKIKTEYSVLPLPFDRELRNREFHMDVDFGMMGIQTGDEVEYFIKVWDNDGYSGPKVSQSLLYKIINPSLDQLFSETDKKTEEISKELDQLSKDSEKLNKEYNKFQQKLIEKKTLDYEDKKQLKQLIEKQNQMNQSLDQIQNKLDQTKQVQKENNMITPETLKKLDQLQNLIKELKSPELNEYLKKIQEQMEKMRPEDLKKEMDQTKLDREQLQKDIERAMDLFKQFQAEQKAQEIVKKLDNLKNRQDQLKEQTEKKNSKEEEAKLKDKQDELNKEMDKIKESISELENLKKETSVPQSEQIQKLEKNQDDAKQNMQNASEQLQQSKSSKASENQKNASDKMKEMMDQLDQMQSSAEAEQDAENLEDLRDILENLIKISFDQEDLRDIMRTLRPNDPQMNQRAQDQRKIRDDMIMLKDSLYALAGRVAEIQKFVTDEVTIIQKSIDRSIEYIGDRNLGMTGSDQQMAMTSMNNLANMLSDAMEDMMQQMKKKGQPMSQSLCKKPGGKKPNMMKLGQQQKELNQKLQDMMKLGKMDPKQLGKMAAEQELIRQQMQEAEKELKDEGKPGLGNMDKVKEDMEKSEQDFINNTITQETLLRQQKILNRMLDATKSVRERDMDEQRQSKSGFDYEKRTPAELSEKEKQEMLRYELLKSLESEYSPAMKLLIEKYFQEFGK